jgi:hypothetical protein
MELALLSMKLGKDLVDDIVDRNVHVFAAAFGCEHDVTQVDVGFGDVTGPFLEENELSLDYVAVEVVEFLCLLVHVRLQVRCDLEVASSQCQVHWFLQ